MFEQMTEQEARGMVLESVRQYCEKFHMQHHQWEAGQRVPYAGRVYDSREMELLADSALDFWLTAGRYTQQFEQKLAEYLGISFCSFVNSGSSANLLAFMALTSPLLKDRQIRRGDEVITVAAGFPTTVAPVVQYGAVPVFVDITIPEYNVDVSMLEEAYSSRTKAVLLAHTLGNPFDIQAVKEFCDRHGLWLVEDNCDALGSMYGEGGDKKLTGTFGDIASSSFYPPHHITTGEGGAVYTDDPLLHRIVRSLRDWGRDCQCPPGQDGACGRRFDGQYGELPPGYDHKYVYAHFGYNLKATDMQAAVGCGQLEKLPAFAAQRRRHFRMLEEALAPVRGRVILPRAQKHSDPCWFGFALTCREGVRRTDVVRRMEEKGVQTRMLFAGNLTRHPCFTQMKAEGRGYRVVGELANTDRVMRDTFWIGVYPGMTDEMAAYAAQAVLEAV